MGKSWNIPKIDVYDPSLVLYAPLWRPDMVARGGAIKNGTGALSVSPIALAVGANTITVSTAGTFVVNIPQGGGTVASGTTTVTGSPVTVLAGISSTITTTGVTGTITVTVSNVIRSKDSTGRLMTVAGATWGSQGRTFDGSSDIILSTVYDFTGDYTVGIWFYFASNPAAVGIPFSKYADGAAESQWVIRVDTTGVIQCYHRGSDGLFNTLLSATNQNGTWHNVFLTFKVGTGSELFLDGESVATDNTTVLGCATSTKRIFIGRQDAVQTRRFIGTIGETYAITRVQGQGEIRDIIQGTKWRYQ